MPRQCNGDNVENDIMMLYRKSASGLRGVPVDKKEWWQKTLTQYNGDNVEHDINKKIQYMWTYTVCI